MTTFQSRLLWLVFAAWVSSVTMLLPFPPFTIEWLKAHNVEPPYWLIWGRWLLNLAFIVGGATAVYLARRGRHRALSVAVLFSLVYVAYWLSEYVMARSPAIEVVKLVLYQLKLGGWPTKIGVFQHQVVLPLIHLLFVAVVARGYLKPRHAI
jgi:hypothetical protein